MRILTPLALCAVSFFAPYAVGSEGLIEDQYFDAAGASGSVRALENFVLSFPDSRYVSVAEGMISELHVAALATPAVGLRYVQ